MCVVMSSMQGGDYGGQKTPGRPRGRSERVRNLGLEVRALRCSATPEPIVEDLLHAAGHRLDYAEKPLQRPRRDWRTRKAQERALRRLGETGRHTSDPWHDPAVLGAFIGWLEATAAVLAAEPDEYRDWLPDYIREDPEAAIGAEIGRTQAERESAARRRVRDWERLSRKEREGLERELRIPPVLGPIGSVSLREDWVEPGLGRKRNAGGFTRFPPSTDGQV
jgi:hypothetical protein